MDEKFTNYSKDFWDSLLDISSGTTQYDMFSDKPVNITMTSGGTTIGSTTAGNLYPYNINTGAYTISTTTTGPGNFSWKDSLSESALHVKGDAKFDGDLKIKGISLSDRLDEIEKRLNILRPNEKLEEKWDELKALGEAYRKLEAEIIEKQKMWDLLKK